MMAHFVGLDESKNFCFMKFSLKSRFQPLGSNSVILTPINLLKSVFVAAMKDLFVVCREFRVQDPKLNSARGPGFDSPMQGQSGAVLYTGCAQ